MLKNYLSVFHFPYTHNLIIGARGTEKSWIILDILKKIHYLGKINNCIVISPTKKISRNYANIPSTNY
jgi:hypothetical protein